MDSIKAHHVYDYCKTISLPKFAGRLTGHEGYTAAARWAAAKFKQWGLKPINIQEGFFQAYPSPYTLVENAESPRFTRGDNCIAVSNFFGKFRSVISGLCLRV